MDKQAFLGGYKAAKPEAEYFLSKVLPHRQDLLDNVSKIQEYMKRTGMANYAPKGEAGTLAFPSEEARRQFLRKLVSFGDFKR
jgi:hypothetical protein